MDKWKKFCLHLTAAASWFLTQSSLTTAQPPAIVPEELNDTDEIYLRQHKSVRANDSKVASQIDELLEDELDETINYGHRSHSSHSSHSSHYSGETGKHRSHVSHQSHYSAQSHYSSHNSHYSAHYDTPNSSNKTSGDERTSDKLSPPRDSSKTSGGNGSRNTSSAPKKDIIPIIDIQRQLNDLGYNCGVEDGKKGPATINAIKTFQRDYDLTADGFVDWKTESWLNSTSIADVRAALQNFGYSFYSKSGKGRTSEVIDAICDFQSKHKLTSHGRIDRKTKKALGLGG